MNYGKMNHYQLQLIIWFAAYLRDDKDAYDEANKRLTLMESNRL